MTEGLARLVELDEAAENRWSARAIRAEASKYSTEYDWVRNAHRYADKLEKQAQILEGHNQKGK